jgi:mediator of RNA polymerase II transcription subunit 30
LFANNDFILFSSLLTGQETVQELVSRVQECFQLLKNLQPPNGSAQSTSMATDKKNKLDDQLKMVKVLFKRLRIIYNKCNENSQEMDSYPLDSMLPTQSNLVDWKYADRVKSEQYLAAVEEKKELYDQILVKNRHLQGIF